MVGGREIELWVRSNGVPVAENEMALGTRFMDDLEDKKGWWAGSLNCGRDCQETKGRFGTRHALASFLLEVVPSLLVAKVGD